MRIAFFSSITSSLTSVPGRLRRRASACAALLLCALCASPGRAAPVDPDERSIPVQSPNYGDALFQFYQEHYFQSITALMVSQHFERVAPHVDEAEVLRGGMLLSYGMPNEAGAIFAQMIERGAAPSVRDRAWFYLAKIRYQRGELPEAQKALALIGTHLPASLAEERGLLQANLAMATDDFAGAAAQLGAMNAAKSSSATSRYVRFNLGVAMIRSGEVVAGNLMLDELGRAPAENEEFRVLRDRANLALGFAALQAKHPEAARVFLERVRLTGANASKALLGFGWAADEMKSPKLALVSWMELGQRDTSDAAVLESRLAVPYAYAELEAYGQALARYTDAINEFDRELHDLDESIAAIRSGKLITAMLKSNPGEEMGWFRSLDQLPEMPHTKHLAPVLAQHEFQEAFKDYRDLHLLARNLAEWNEKLVVFGDMLVNRQAGYATRLPEIRAKAETSGLPVLQQRVDALSAEIATAANEPDGTALADTRQLALKARLDRVRTALEAAGDDPDVVQARERYRLVAGALSWQLAARQPAQARAAQKGLREIDTQLREAIARDAALTQAQRDEPARFAKFAERIRAFGPRLKVMAPRVDALAKEEQRAMQEIAVAELERQKTRLIDYGTQARFAVAQLFDRANQQRETSRAGKQ